MKNLRRLGLCFTLLCVLSTGALADGPCVLDPGATNSPPCAAAQIPLDDTETASQNSASPESSAAEAWVSEVTFDLIESVLSIF